MTIYNPNIQPTHISNKILRIVFIIGFFGGFAFEGFKFHWILLEFLHLFLRIINNVKCLNKPPERNDNIEEIYIHNFKSLRKFLKCVKRTSQIKTLFAARIWSYLEKIFFLIFTTVYFIKIWPTMTFHQLWRSHFLFGAVIY